MAAIQDYPIFAKLQSAGCDLRETKPGKWDGHCPCNHRNAAKQKLHIEFGHRGGLVLCCEAGAGCKAVDIVRAVNGMASDLYAKFRPIPTSSPPQGKPKKKIVATYDYLSAPDIEGKSRIVHQTVRFEPKDFRQRCPDGNDGWKLSLADVETILYRLPQILAADASQIIVLVEGEKDADNAATKLGLTTTTNPMGAKKWKSSYTESLRGRHVVIVPDNDKPDEKTSKPIGWEHVVAVANALHGVATSVRVVLLPNPPVMPDGLPNFHQLVPKWDISDWITAGGTREQFDAAVAVAAPWNPAEHQAESKEPNEADNDPHRLARLFIWQHTFADQPTIRFWRGLWYRWHDGYYEPIDPEEMRCRVVATIKAEFDRLNIEKLKNHNADGEEPPPKALPVTVTGVGSVMQSLRSMCLLSAAIESPSVLSADGLTGESAKHLVSLRNGVLDIRKFLADELDVITPHSPSLFTLAALPIAFDPAADCPLWRAFLARNLGDDDRCEMLQEWFGICTTFNNSFQSFLMLEGTGSNGKSVICSALTAFLGQRNVSHVPLECFGETFHLSGTVGKLANIVNEIGEVEKANEGTLKSYTSGDRMTFNRKNLPLFEAVPTARLVMATNALPRFADRSNGVWRRMLLLPLDVVISDAERVAGMDSVEWWAARPSELAGILMWALTGLARLMAPPHRFTKPASMVTGMAEYQLDCFPARRFLIETYEPNEHGEVATHEVYQLYKKWCDDHGNKPQASNTFAKEIKKVFPFVKSKRWVIRQDGKKTPGYIGIEVIGPPPFGSDCDDEEKNKILDRLFQ